MMMVGAPPYNTPSRRDPTFKYLMDGKVKELLGLYRRLPLVTDEIVDCLTKILTKESSRITMEELRKHPFVAV